MCGYTSVCVCVCVCVLLRVCYCVCVSVFETETCARTCVGVIADVDFAWLSTNRNCSQGLTILNP